MGGGDGVDSVSNSDDGAAAGRVSQSLRGPTCQVSMCPRSFHTSQPNESIGSFSVSAEAISGARSRKSATMNGVYILHLKPGSRCLGTCSLVSLTYTSPLPISATVNGVYIAYKVRLHFCR